MREIKFRAWDKVNEIMCEVEGITFDENGDITFLDTWDKEHGYQEAQEIKYFELLRYTGLKDKNGKEIYEGDILKVDINKFIAPGYLHNKEPFNVEISFKNYHWTCSNGKGKSLYNYTTISYAELEVVGNKYDNPELEEMIGG